MKCPQLLFVCWCSSIFAVTSCFRVDGYSCISTFRDTITCVLNITGNPAGPSNANYSLNFTDIRMSINYICPLVLMNHTYSCVCKVLKQYGFNSLYNYTIQLCNQSGCQSLRKGFAPSKNTVSTGVCLAPIKEYKGIMISKKCILLFRRETEEQLLVQLTPPYDVKAQPTPEHFNITWASGYETERYIGKFLDYELLIQRSQSSWSQTLKSRLQFESILRSQLDADATYCIKVRSKPPEDLGYKGFWSKWSPTTCWKTEARAEQGSLLVILTRSLGPVCLVVGALLFVFYSPTARMKIKTLSHTPSPAPFFQPLFQHHEGNLQEWFSPQGKFALTYKTEENMITNAVTVVPKPITKDPEEDQDFHNPSAPKLAFSQCQSSYVGLPETHETLNPMTMVCPGNTSYTQLPCSVWGLGNGEVQVFPSPPQTFLEISRTDSGCSCEDLTQSLECSLPNSPVNESSPPCFSTDYCILNKTAEGVVPVLVTK